MSVETVPMETRQDESGSSVVGSGMSLIDRVALDLASYLDNFPNKSFAIRYLAKESGLNEKTIKRLLKRENRPTYQTLFRLYSTFLGMNDYQKLLNACPIEISEYLKEYTPCESITSERNECEFLSLISKDPVMGELYVLAGCGTLTKSSATYRYGEYGMGLLKKLETSGFLISLDNETWQPSKNAPNLDAKVLKKLGEHFVARYSKPSQAEVRGENAIAFYAESLNEKGKQAWMEIDSKAFYDKLKVANNPDFRGDQPMFTFTATDSIAPENHNV